MSMPDVNADTPYTVPSLVTRKVILGSSLQTKPARCSNRTGNHANRNEYLIHSSNSTVSHNFSLYSHSDTLCFNNTCHGSAPPFVYCELSTGQIKERVAGNHTAELHSESSGGLSSNVLPLSSSNSLACLKMQHEDRTQYNTRESVVDTGEAKEKLRRVRCLLREEKLLRRAACDARSDAICASLEDREEASRLRIMLTEANERSDTFFKHTRRRTQSAAPVPSLLSSSGEYKTDRSSHRIVSPFSNGLSYLSENTLSRASRLKRPKTCPSALSSQRGLTGNRSRGRRPGRVINNKFMSVDEKRDDACCSSFCDEDFKPSAEEGRPLLGHVHDSDLLRALQRAEYRVQRLEKELRVSQDIIHSMTMSSEPRPDKDREDVSAVSCLHRESTMQTQLTSPYYPLTTRLTIM